MSRIRPLKFVLAIVALPLIIAGVQLSNEVYRFLRFGEEREVVRTLRPRLLESGALVMQTRMLSDSMRERIRDEDRRLEAEQRALRRYDRMAVDGALPHEVYQDYRRDLNRYNRHVTTRNALLREWQDILARNHASVDSYNTLADSIRAAAQRMGEPYYQVPSPVEAALARGLIKPES